MTGKLRLYANVELVEIIEKGWETTRDTSDTDEASIGGKKRDGSPINPGTTKRAKVNTLESKSGVGHSLTHTR